MRILDRDGDHKLDRILLCLTLNEAKELRESLKALIDKPTGNHAHIPDEGFEKEVTVCIYGGSLDGFDKRTRDLIELDR